MEIATLQYSCNSQTFVAILKLLLDSATLQFAMLKSCCHSISENGKSFSNPVRWWGECQQNCEFYSPWGAGMEISAKEFGMGVNLHGALFWGKRKTLLGKGDGLAVPTFSREFSQSGISHFRLSIEYDCIRWRHISANIYRNNLEFPSDSSPIFYLRASTHHPWHPHPCLKLTSPSHLAWISTCTAHLRWIFESRGCKMWMYSWKCGTFLRPHRPMREGNDGRQKTAAKFVRHSRKKLLKKSAESDLSLVVLV